MNENMEFETFSFNNVCRVCLKTRVDLSPMSGDHVNLFRNLVEEIAYQECSMRVCMVCGWLLQKYAKFRRQCWTANNLLSQLYEDTKSINFLEKFTSVHNFCRTQPEPSQYIPRINTQDNYIKHHYTIDNNTQETQPTIIYTDDIIINDHSDTDYDIKTTNCDLYTKNDNSYDCNDTGSAFETFAEKNNTCINDEDKNDMIFEGVNDCDTNLSEDEMPLLLLSKKKERTKKKNKAKEITINSNIAEPDTIKQENRNFSKKSKRISKQKHKNALSSLKEDLNNDLVETKTEKKSKNNMKLKEGFSSRMVQETSEYIVIKRTKQQVLQEMSERSQSEAYINMPYKCGLCVKGFNFQEVLDTHLEKHSEKNGPLQCNMCHQYCPSAVSLRGHIKSHTTRYQCKVCGCVKASRQHLLEHHAAHLGAGTQYCCDSCPFTTDKRTVMQRHARTHGARAQLACPAPACGRLCAGVGSLRLHLARHNKASRHKCGECGKSFVYYSLLRRHVQFTHRNRDLYCVECDVHFTSPDSLKAHLKKAKRHRDTVDNKHVCESCGKSCPTWSSLAAHMSAAHLAPRAHACPHCPHRRYSSRDTLRAHMWRSHARGDAPATCQHCGHTFARKSTLSVHLRTHTGERPHVCACGAAFAHTHTLRAHIHNKHKGEELHQYESKNEV